MSAVFEWWNALSGLNRALYILAFGFSLFFLWQLVGVMLGLGATEHDIGVDHAAGPGGGDPNAAGDVLEAANAFQLFSVRSVAAFLTIFAWASALYMNLNYNKLLALTYGVAWGFAALVAVALLLHWLVRLQHSGNLNINAAVGRVGTVHLDVLPDAMGEIRVLVGGVLTHLRARSVAGSPPIKAGALVKVTRVIEPTIVEVAPEGAVAKPADGATRPAA